MFQHVAPIENWCLKLLFVPSNAVRYRFQKVGNETSNRRRSLLWIFSIFPSCLSVYLAINSLPPAGWYLKLFSNGILNPANTPTSGGVTLKTPERKLFPSNVILAKLVTLHTSGTFLTCPPHGVEYVWLNGGSWPVNKPFSPVQVSRNRHTEFWTTIGGRCHKYHFCRGKFCRDELTFVATNTSFVATNVCLSRQAHVCHEKNIFYSDKSVSYTHLTLPTRSTV